MMHCFTNNLSLETWHHEVISNLEKRHGYKDIEQLYLNPGTKFPYVFPEINA